MGPPVAHRGRPEPEVIILEYCRRDLRRPVPMGLSRGDREARSSGGRMSSRRSSAAAGRRTKRSSAARTSGCSRARTNVARATAGDGHCAACIRGRPAVSAATSATRARAHHATAGVDLADERGQHRPAFQRPIRSAGPVGAIDFPVIGARGSFASPCSMTNRCCSEYQGPVTSAAGAVSASCSTY